MPIVHPLGHALAVAGSMGWQILWALVLGFTLSAVVQALVRRERIVALLGDDRSVTVARAAGLGAASSSCSYAAVALARTLFRKGASFTAAMVFEIASTNLVLELGVVMALLLGWQFTLAEFVAGPVMIVLVALVFRLVVRTSLLDRARVQAERGLVGSMEGHAGMDMSVPAEGSLWVRLRSARGATAVSHIFVMEWAAVLRDILGGLALAGAIAAWVPNSWWTQLFVSADPTVAKVWSPLVGPLVAIASFVCSVGNVPLAAVLWSGGISFGGVVAFILADLLILPILAIYRRYYGTRMMLTILGVFYVTMVLAAYLVEVAFGGLGLVPTDRATTVTGAGISWNYTTWLNIAALLLATALLVRFVRTGGLPMLRMMNTPPEQMTDHEGHRGHAAHEGHTGQEGHGSHG